MKIYLRFPSGTEFNWESTPREPMENGKFYALVLLAAAALVVLLLLGSSALKYMGK